MSKNLFLILVLGFIPFTSNGQGTVSRTKEIPKAKTAVSVSTLMEKANDNYEKGNFSEAIRLWNGAAQEGNQTAMYNIGWCYYAGEGVEKNSQKAVEWWIKATSPNYLNGNKQALFMLGNCYRKGDGVEKDDVMAYKYYEQACNRAYTPAYALCADCKFYGKGTSVNIVDALCDYENGAKAGDPYAQYRYSICLYEGVGIDVDYSQGYEWAMKAAMNGYAPAYACVADYHYYGKGKDQSYEEAVKWIKKGADAGDAYSIYLLGYAYIKGEGIEKDQIKGLELYREAARKGEKLAIEALERRNLTY